MECRLQVSKRFDIDIGKVWLVQFKVMGSCLNFCEVGTIPCYLGQESSNRYNRWGRGEGFILWAKIFLLGLDGS